MKKTHTRKSIIEKRGYRKDIVGDKFSLYISNYPAVVHYLRGRLGNQNKIIAELCCGIGVTLEYISKGFQKAIGVELDENIAEQCRANLNSVGLTDKVEVITGDINDIEMLKKIRADIVFYDIPFWSAHTDERRGNLINKNPLLVDVISKIKQYITEDIVIFCPPKFEYRTIKKEVGVCEFERVFINGKHDRTHIYLGKLKQTKGITNLELVIS